MASYLEVLIFVIAAAVFVLFATGALWWIRRTIQRSIDKVEHE
jgi:hypothetical protein